MRITTKLVLDIETGNVLEREWHEYIGPIALCGGGPSQQQKDAATQEAANNSKLSAAADRAQAFKEASQKQVNPFFTERMNNGIPYFNLLTDAQSGLNARAFAPARGELTRRLGAYSSLPSGFREGALTDLASEQARSFDSGLAGALQENEAAKRYGAAGILGQVDQANPLGYYGAANQGYNNILSAQTLSRPGLAGLIGGLAGAGATAYAGR